MKKSKLFRSLPIVLTVGLMSFSSVSSAKLWEFSRANCFPPGGADYGNESITFMSSEKRLSRVFSRHYKHGKMRHQLDTGWEYLWNNNGAAHRDNTGQSLWTVVGFHYLKSGNNKTFLSKRSQTDNCNFSLPY